MKILKRMAIFLALFSLILLLVACNSDDSAQSEITISFVDGDTIVSEGVLDRETFITPIAPAKSNMDFVGWYFDAEFSEPFDVAKIDENISDNAIKVYARYVTFVETKAIITITYVVENKTFGTVNISDNGTFTMPEDPTKDFHTFNGWYTDEALLIKFDYMSAITNGIKEDLTLYAKFTENTARFTFKSEGSIYKELDVKMSEVAAMPSDPFVKDKVFIYWQEIGTNEPFNIDNYYEEQQLRDVNLEAIFINQTVEVQLYNDTDIIKTITLRYDQNLVLEPLSKTLTHEFDKWVMADGSDFDLASYNANKFRNNIKIYASWTPRTNTIRFYDGNKLYKTIIIDEHLTFEMPANPNRDGMIFDNWYYRVDGIDRAFDKEEYLHDINRKDIDMYAHFNDINIVIEWWVNGKIAHTDKLVKAEKLKEFQAPKVNNNTFIEWQYNGANLDIRALNSMIENDSVTGEIIKIIGIYEPKVTRIQFIHDGYEWHYIDYTDNTNYDAEKPPAPTKEGFLFAGWYYDDETFTKEFNIEAYKNDPNRKDISLYPKFEPIK